MTRIFICIHIRFNPNSLRFKVRYGTRYIYRYYRKKFNIFYLCGRKVCPNKYSSVADSRTILSSNKFLLNFFVFRNFARPQFFLQLFLLLVLFVLIGRIILFFPFTSSSSYSLPSPIESWQRS